MTRKIEIIECRHCKGAVVASSHFSLGSCFACMQLGGSLDGYVIANEEMAVMNEDQLLRLVDQGSIEALQYLSKLKAEE